MRKKMDNTNQWKEIRFLCSFGEYIDREQTKKELLFENILKWYTIIITYPITLCFISVRLLLLCFSFFLFVCLIRIPICSDYHQYDPYKNSLLLVTKKNTFIDSFNNEEIQTQSLFYFPMQWNIFYALAFSCSSSNNK